MREESTNKIGNSQHGINEATKNNMAGGGSGRGNGCAVSGRGARGHGGYGRGDAGGHGRGRGGRGRAVSGRWDGMPHDGHAPVSGQQLLGDGSSPYPAAGTVAIGGQRQQGGRVQPWGATRSSPRLRGSNTSVHFSGSGGATTVAVGWGGIGGRRVHESASVARSLQFINGTPLGGGSSVSTLSHSMSTSTKRSSRKRKGVGSQSLRTAKRGWKDNYEMSYAGKEVDKVVGDDEQDEEEDEYHDDDEYLHDEQGDEENDYVNVTDGPQQDDITPEQKQAMAEAEVRAVARHRAAFMERAFPPVTAERRQPVSHQVAISQMGKVRSKEDFDRIVNVVHNWH